MNRHLLRFVLLLFAPIAVLAQGDLNPPAAPAPSMKRLDQLEPRIDIATLPGDETAHHIISQPGSYYLSGNLAVTKAQGIFVNAAHVTVDLQGFHIARSSGAGGLGIFISNTADQAVVENGSISGFDFGVRASSSSGVAGGAYRRLRVSGCMSRGIEAGARWQVESCQAIENSGSGILTGGGSTVRDCVASGNTGQQRGIDVGDSSAVLNCSANGNTAEYGIYTGGGSTLLNCTANGNTSAGTNSGGIFAGPESTVIGCSARGNSSTNAVKTGTTGKGISISASGIVKDCTASFNEGDGIRADLWSLVKGNTCVRNGRDAGTGAGITAERDHNRIQENQVTDNDIGIRALGTGNLIEGNHVRNHPGPGIAVTTANGKNVIIRNVAGDNVNSYTSIAAGNDVGPITTTANATSPVGNLQN